MKVKIVRSLIIITAVVVACFILAQLLVSYEERKVERLWAESDSPTSSFLAQYPEREDSETARRLTEVAGMIGIDARPKASPIGHSPSEEAEKAFTPVKADLTAYITQQIVRPTDRIDDLPDSAGRFFQSQSQNIARVKEEILASEVPQWISDFQTAKWDEDGPAIPFPNFMGLMTVEKLMIGLSLKELRDGRQADALQSLEAAWRINESLRSRPELISQLTAIAMTRYQLGILRKVDRVPPVWQKRLERLLPEYQNSFLQSCRFEAFYFHSFAQGVSKLGNQNQPLWIRYSPRMLLELYLRFCAVDSSRRTWTLTHQLRSESLCSFDPQAFERTHPAILMGKWNIKHDSFRGFVDTWRRLVRLSVEAELTSKIARIKDSAASSPDRAWPTEVSGIERSACAELKWNYSGSQMFISLNKKLQWPDQIGAILPTEYRMSK